MNRFLSFAPSIAGFTLCFVISTGNVWASPNSDNTSLNARDNKQTEVTSMDQGGSKSDVQITRDLRRLIVKQKSFSTYAKNIKIITNQGVVTLKGPVKTDAEKSKILAFAKESVGSGKVVDQIDIK